MKLQSINYYIGKFGFACGLSCFIAYWFSMFNVEMGNLSILVIFGSCILLYSFYVILFTDDGLDGLLSFGEEI